MKYIVGILLSISSLTALAQDSTSVATQTIQWNASGFTDVISNVTVSLKRVI